MQQNCEPQFIKIIIIENAIEAQLLSSVLDQRNIPHIVRSYHDTAYDGLFQFQKGWGRLYAPQSYRPEILALVEDMRSEYEWEQEEDCDAGR
ncbi:MAG: hypothetical protein V2I56_07125 [Desulfobacteraceae bacterium]|jgi:hypothetical protein|nr:hypothetical protein [Desulfobacteraceae bacterium]